MTKDQLTSYVRRVLIGREAMADDQKSYHFARVAQAVGYAFDTLVAQLPMTPEGKAKIESFYVKHYYDQPVKESNDYRYFAVDDSVVSVGEGRGIWYVQSSGKLIPPSHRPKMALFSSMAVGEALNETFWRFGNLATKKQIVLENIGDSPTQDIRKVDYGVVRAFSSYGDDEEVIFPDRMDLLVEMAATQLGGRQVDDANNNA